MRKVLFIVILFFFTNFAFSQVKVLTDGSLEINSSTGPGQRVND
jgi:hypothetical protein